MLAECSTVLRLWTFLPCLHWMQSITCTKPISGILFVNLSALFFRRVMQKNLHKFSPLQVIIQIRIKYLSTQFIIWKLSCYKNTYPQKGETSCNVHTSSLSVHIHVQKVKLVKTWNRKTQVRMIDLCTILEIFVIKATCCII